MEWAGVAGGGGGVLTRFVFKQRRFQARVCSQHAIACPPPPGPEPNGHPDRLLRLAWQMLPRRHCHIAPN